MNGVKSRRAASGLSTTVIAAIATAVGVVLSTTSASAEPNDRTTTATTATESHRSTGTYYVASLVGANEVQKPGGPKVGDPHGRALEFLRIEGDKVQFAIKWSGIGAPTMAHIHAGARGVNGEVKVAFFEQALPGSLHAVTGSVTVKDAKLLKEISANPGDFYVNVHTAQFPGGAVRGQLHKVRPFTFGKALTSIEASVISGQQIYACTKQPGGGWAFTQHNVDARLGHGIYHSFVRPNAGPPQWVAADGSAVTGKVLSKTANGTGNVPELDLKATREGRAHGVLSGTHEVLRLNTLGGTAPTGSCAPYTQPKTAVPYHADYVFIKG
ncbi:CHRD domain-containing protein [Streptantibioticus rubrisoli]|uniref:CHRD domain-containing protein n=1 Tax=Streptantibioticus rubrisoli TaxID=1387313 RepID=A0ABT1PM50_9ACTN|nr:CHRD domain-containing protein [Streptantibioticus rubrisoli]MCQ4045313.1 CHRD domain-containing protein [Streptantibioticus rubrisoli]